MFPSIVYGDKQKVTFDELYNDLTPKEKQKIKNDPFDKIWNTAYEEKHKHKLFDENQLVKNIKKIIDARTPPVNQSVPWETKFGYIGTISTPEGEKVGLMKSPSMPKSISDEFFELLAENKELKHKIRLLEEKRANYDDMPGLIPIDDMDYNKDNSDFTIRIEI